MKTKIGDSDRFELTKPTKKFDYSFEQSQHGEWKIYHHKNGSLYKEFRSYAEFFDLPMVSIVSGVSPETKRQGHARGVLAIGPKATGVIAIGQLSQGYIAIGQLAVGRVFALGQVAVAPLAIGQLGLFGIGIAQLGIGGLGIFQSGLAIIAGIGQQVHSLGLFQ